MDKNKFCLGCMEEKGAGFACQYCGYVDSSGANSPHHLKPGTLLNNRYLIGKVLGQGGFGITYIAWDMDLDIKLAIKEYFPQGLVARSPGTSTVDTYTGDMKNQYYFGLDRFLEEAKTLARFSEHPNIVTVRDFFKANGTAYMVVNYLEGVTLEEHLKRQKDERITFPLALSIMMPVMDALREVHNAGIMHRDISPDNIFIRNDGRVVLIDFGAARQELQQKSRGLSVIMKAGYSPEEQYRSNGVQGPWTDIYALAATIYRAITGEIPLESMDRMVDDLLVPPSQFGVAIDSSKEEALLKGLALRAEDRYRTIEEFQDKISQGEMAEETLVYKKEEKDLQIYYSIGKGKQETYLKNAFESTEALEPPVKEESAPQEWKKYTLIATVIIGSALLLYASINIFSKGFDQDETLISEENVALVSSEESEEESEEEVVDEPEVGMVDEESYLVDVDEGRYLFIRKAPGTEDKPSDDRIARVPRGRILEVVNKHNNSIFKDNFTWWEVKDSVAGVRGWVAAEYLATELLEYKLPTNNLESIDAKVEGLRFFESGIPITDLEKRIYSSKFSSNLDRYIFWELHLTFPPSEVERYVLLTLIYYKPDGSELLRENDRLEIPANWSGMYYSGLYGNDTQDFIYSKGTYRVEIIENQKVVARGDFIID